MIPPTYAGTLTEDQLRSLVTTNAAALKLLRTGLNHECRVPIEYSTNYESDALGKLASIKSLVMVLENEGRLAELEHRTYDAAKSYLDAIRFGHEAFRGGLLIQNLVGLACQNIGNAGLQRVVGGMDAQACRATIAALLALETKREKVSEIWAADREFSHRVHGFRMLTWIASVIESRSLAPEKILRLKFEAKTLTTQRQTQLTILKLAARAYELEKGARPKTIADLVPAYLPEIPKDPDTGTNMVYTP